MNYRHAFHAGNHADVLKHIVLLALCDALTAKPTPCYALDTHAGRGLYALDGNSAQRTRESQDGIGRLLAEAPKQPLITRYLAAIKACRSANGPHAYPGSPWLLAHALRADDRITCCELQPEEAGSLQAAFARDPRVAVHERDGYAALRALLPPKLNMSGIGATKFARGLVLIDPPYEAQLDEFDAALSALRQGLERWPQGTFALWYPIKLRRTLHLFYRNATKLQSKSTLLVELLVRPDDSPLRMNGSGLLLLNPPWQLDATLAPALALLRDVMGEAGASARIEWLRAPV